MIYGLVQHVPLWPAAPEMESQLVGHICRPLNQLQATTSSSSTLTRASAARQNYYGLQDFPFADTPSENLETGMKSSIASPSTTTTLLKP